MKQISELVCENGIFYSFMKKYVFYKYKTVSQDGFCCFLPDLGSKMAVPDILQHVTLGLISEAPI